MTVQTVDVLLDVDGVINALAARRGAGGWGHWKPTKVHPYTITYAPELIARLNALAARDGVTFHWLTTWAGRASRGSHGRRDAFAARAERLGFDGHVVGVETVDHQTAGADDPWDVTVEVNGGRARPTGVSGAAAGPPRGRPRGLSVARPSARGVVGVPPAHSP